MPPGTRTTTDALEILYDRYIRNDPESQVLLAVERLNARIAQMIYDMRTEAGLTQRQLAKLVGTTQSVISRLEDSDYQRHSLTMLKRIAKALNREWSKQEHQMLHDFANVPKHTKRRRRQ